MSKVRSARLGLTLVASLAAPALAQQAPPERIAPDAAATAMHDATPAKPPGGNPSTAAFRAAGDRMMRDMSRPMTGDADQDFVAGMLPHHQGAVAMAKIELQYGRDPNLRRLAQAIVAAQEQEIARMREWQRSHPARP